MIEVQTLTLHQPEQSAIDNSSVAGGAAPDAVVPAASVVLPVFNEEGIIEWVVGCVKDFAGEHDDYEFIFVDDGSVDNTPKLISENIALGDCANIKLIVSKQNGGKGAAMKKGFENSKGRAVLFTDGDLAYSLDYIPKLLEGLEENDIVIGSRRIGQGAGGRKSLLRAIMGEGFNKCVRVIMRLPYKDTQAGLKGFSRSAADKLFTRTRIARYSTDVELLYLARKFGFSVAQIPAHVDEKHVSTQSSMNLLKDPPRMFIDMLKIRWNNISGKYSK